MSPSPQAPRLSIGMPVYNGAELICEAIDSLLAQTFTDFELIVSDNASGDETEAICNKYSARDQRIRYVRQAENLGAVANFEFVLSEARGEYFAWAAHDDTWSNTCFADAISKLDTRRYDFAFPQFEVKSIRFNTSKKYDMEIFSFIQSSDRRTRVINFLNLHHHSHKCNIVYSVFSKDFLIKCYQVQDISADGMLAAVILGIGRGTIIRDALFSKRYKYFWPGSKDFLYRIYRNNSKAFSLAKKKGKEELEQLFPEYANEIRTIIDHYKPFSHETDYRICKL